MKQTTLIILIIVSVFFIKTNTAAQGNLQFSQVLFQKYTTPAAIGTYSYNISVPVGKVWKIESASVFAIWINSDMRYLAIDNVKIVWFTSNNFHSVSFPFWLPSGDYVVNIYTASATITDGGLSIIEFTVVP